MLRIEGVNLPDHKRAEVALTYIFGIGRSRANWLLSQAKINKNTKVKDLNDEQVGLLRKLIEGNYKIEGDLKREILTNIKRLKEHNTYRGSRHSKNLPSRGQRTKTNSRTVRGNVRRTMGSGKVKLTKT